MTKRKIRVSQLFLHWIFNYKYIYKEKKWKGLNLSSIYLFTEPNPNSLGWMDCTNGYFVEIMTRKIQQTCGNAIQTCPYNSRDLMISIFPIIFHKLYWEIYFIFCLVFWDEYWFSSTTTSSWKLKIWETWRENVVIFRNVTIVLKASISL